MTLYAEWTLNPVVTFNAGGGTGTMGSETFMSGDPQALTLNAFTRAGYDFAGWGTAPNSSVVYFDQQTITISASVTLYAEWTPVTATYTVTFNANGGSGTMSNETFTSGVPQALTLNGFTRAGYTFAGWGTSSGGPVVYTDGQTVTIGATETLYAIWTAVPTYTVTFNANGGSGTMSNETFTSGVPKALTLNAFTRAGYTFAGWGTSSGGPVVYTNGQTVTIGATETLYAHLDGVDRADLDLGVGELQHPHLRGRGRRDGDRDDHRDRGQRADRDRDVQGGVDDPVHHVDVPPGQLLDLLGELQPERHDACRSARTR